MTPALTLGKRVGVTLRHLLRGEMIAVLELVLSHPVPDRLRFGGFDDRNGSLKQGAGICDGTSAS